MVQGLLCRYRYNKMSRLDPVTGILGHRGFAFKARENSIAAFKQALEAGASGIELDVWQCKSGEFVVHHDPVISKSSRIQDSLLSRLRKDYREEILLLDEVFDHLEHCVINVEVKTSPKTEEGEKSRIIASLGSLIESRSNDFDFVISAFDRDLAVGLSAFRDFAKAALLLGIRSKVDREIEFCVDNGLGLVHLNWHRASPRTISKLREANLGYSLWTVNARDAISNMINIGAQYLITDQVALAVGMCRQ